MPLCAPQSSHVILPSWPCDEQHVQLLHCCFRKQKHQSRRCVLLPSAASTVNSAPAFPSVLNFATTQALDRGHVSHPHRSHKAGSSASQLCALHETLRHCAAHQPAGSMPASSITAVWPMAAFCGAGTQSPIASTTATATATATQCIFLWPAGISGMRTACVVAHTAQLLSQVPFVMELQGL